MEDTFKNKLGVSLSHFIRTSTAGTISVLLTSIIDKIQCVTLSRLVLTLGPSDSSQVCKRYCRGFRRYDELRSPSQVNVTYDFDTSGHRG